MPHPLYVSGKSPVSVEQGRDGIKSLGSLAGTKEGSRRRFTATVEVQAGCHCRAIQRFTTTLITDRGWHGCSLCP